MPFPEPAPPSDQARWEATFEPDEAHIMKQSWRDLLFLHWHYPRETIQATLPRGLTVDTFEGRAWVGVVPFFMRDVHPRFVPAVPFLSNFLELNVRTYVLDPEGRPGVWFYSLDCNNAVAVAAARVGFFLPYYQADMSAEENGGIIDYRSQRNGSNQPTRFRYGGHGEAKNAKPGSLDFFLIERYALFSRDPASGDIHTGRVFHKPYPLTKPELRMWDAAMLEANGLAAPGRGPDAIHFSPGVEVRIYRPHRCYEAATV